jgi:hypothetical protein
MRVCERERECVGMCVCGRVGVGGWGVRVGVCARERGLYRQGKIRTGRNDTDIERQRKEKKERG